jgi:hypothetical protein
MKLKFFTAAAIVAFSATGALASENICGFNSNQLSRGFHDGTTTVTTSPVTRQLSSGECQTGEAKTTTTLCINQNGSVMDSRTVEEIDESKWGRPHACSVE